jgi:hypothetical protein
MFNIGDYLKKFSTFGAQESLLNDAIRQVIQDKTGTVKDKITVTVKGSIAYVTTDRSTKNLIFLSKGDILETVAKYNLRKKISDIR